MNKLRDDMLQEIKQRFQEEKYLKKVCEASKLQKMANDLMSRAQVAKIGLAELKTEDGDELDSLFRIMWEKDLKQYECAKNDADYHWQELPTQPYMPTQKYMTKMNKVQRKRNAWKAWRKRA